MPRRRRSVTRRSSTSAYTTVTAAQPGRVVSLTAAVGEFVQPSTSLAMFVPDEIWVTANFKETQLDRHASRPAGDARDRCLSGRVIQGHVASVQPGSGTAFSLLPAENATGNFVKIVQRVPVKLVIDIGRPTSRSGRACRSCRACASTPQPSLFQRLVGRA